MKRKVDINDIITCAIDILDNQGLDYVTLKEISSRLSIQSPSLYNHVKGLDDILVKVANKSFENLYDSLVNSVIGLDKKKAFYELSNQYRKFYMLHKGQYVLIQQVKLWNKDKTVSDESDNFLHLLKQILKQFNLSERDTTHFIRAWRSYMHGFLLLETNGSFALNEDVDTSFNYGLDILKYRLENKSVE